DAVLDDVIQRAHDADSVICSPAYLLTGYWNFIESDDQIDQYEEANRLRASVPLPEPVIVNSDALARSRRSEQKELERDRLRAKNKFEALWAESVRRGEEYRSKILL